jgi:serpin B
MRSLTLRASIFLALASVGCGSSSPGADQTAVVKSSLARDTAPSVSTTDTAQLALDDTTFALDLYQKLDVPKMDNLVYSPYSVSVAAAMLSAGAVGATADGIRTALHFTLPDATLHPAFDSVDLALASRAKDTGTSGAAGRPFQLSVANSLWGDKTLVIEDTFLDTLAVNYGSGVHLVDFEKEAEPSRTAINGWVSNETNDRIKDLLPKDSIRADTRFVLVNVIYFDAGWTTKFDHGQTRQDDFHRLDGSTIKVDMMALSDHVSAGYAETSTYQAVELTYAG